MRRSRRFAVLLLMCAAPSYAQQIPSTAQIQSGVTADKLTVNTQKAALTQRGISTRPTYQAVATGLATTAAYNMSIEASASTGFKLVGWCVGVSHATAAALVTVTVQRRTTASSAGTAATAEGTASPAVSKADPADSNFGGVVRITGTLGSAGAVLDGQGFMVGEIGAGAADASSISSFCKSYGTNGEKMPTVAAGTANGLSINVSAPGAGGLASGSISATIIAE